MNGNDLKNSIFRFSEAPIMIERWNNVDRLMAKDLIFYYIVVIKSKVQYKEFKKESKFLASYFSEKEYNKYVKKPLSVEELNSVANKYLYMMSYYKPGNYFYFNGFSSQIYVNKVLKVPYEIEMALYKAKKEQVSNEMSEILNTFSNLLEENYEKTYIRFDKIPEDERSYNFREEKYEKGVSVFTAYKLNNDYIVFMTGNTTIPSYTYEEYVKNKSAYEVCGNEIGEGLLINCSTVKKISKNNLYYVRQYVSKLFNESKELAENFKNN